MRKIFTIVIALFSLVVSAKSFVTDGNGIRNTVTATVKGKSVLYISELDGAIAAYSIDGKKIWEVATDKKALVFKLKASDINGDGNDDLLVASADGNIYCWSSKGQLLWKYSPKSPVSFTEVAVVKNNGKSQVFAGGNDSKLYELDTEGKEVSTTKINGVFRLMDSGNFLSADREDLFVMTYGHDKYRWEVFGIIDTETKAFKKQLPKNKKLKMLSKMMITDFEVADITKDGLDDLLFYGTNTAGVFIGLDGQFNQVAEYIGKNKEKQRYAHSQGACLLPVRDEIAFQHGGFMHRLSLKGEDLEVTGSRYGEIIFNQLAFDAASKQLFAGGQVGGGNKMYTYPVNKASWLTTPQTKEGRMIEVQKNIEKLYQQALKFTPPSYQTKSEKEWVMITPFQPEAKVMKKKGGDLKLVVQESWKENTSREELVAAIGKDALKKDKRGKYNLSRAEIIKMAKAYESKGEPFTIWAGHVTDPFYLHIETLEQILEVAPNTCYGFVYAEMHDPNDPRVVHFVNEYMPRLATALRKNGKAKLYFRYKNMFWGASSHQGIWKDMFYSGKYADILVPAAEDTSSRTQDVNFSGRVGMLMGGFVDDYAMRLVDDNPTSWRPYTPGGQRSVSPYLRNGIMMAAYGGHYGIIFNNNYLEDPGLNSLFALMTSGAIPLVEKEDIESVSSWMLIKDVNADLIHSVDDHHNMKQFKTDDTNAVIANSQMHWAGSTINDYDYSKALGSDYRWMNYMPEMPNGMIPVGPVEMEKDLKGAGIPYFVTDLKTGFVDGKEVAAKEFGKTISSEVSKGAAQMRINVKGASWCAVRIDETHIRVIMVDQGYINPQDREVTITFNGSKPSKAVDILSKENIKVSDAIKTIVPAGSAKFIDFTFE